LTEAYNLIIRIVGLIREGERAGRGAVAVAGGCHLNRILLSLKARN
jgi:hypothetical protein